MIEFVGRLAGRQIVISGLTQTEARSAICKARSTGAVSPDEASSELERLSREMVQFVEQPLSPHVIETANQLVDGRNLRALDAIQLASAMLARSSLQSQEMTFVVSDKQLLKAAGDEGFPIWDPSH